MKFLADDGTIFTNIDDCEEYEHYQLYDGADARKIIQKFVTLYDDNSQNISLPTTSNCIHWWMDFHDIVSSTARYIVISYKCALADWVFTKNFELNEFGFELPDDIGIYKYNDDINDWEFYEGEEE